MEYNNSCLAPGRGFTPLSPLLGDFDGERSAEHFQVTERLYKMFQDEQVLLSEENPVLRSFVSKIESQIKQEFILLVPDLFKTLNSKEERPGKKVGSVDESFQNLKILKGLNMYLSKLLKHEQISEEDINLSSIEKVILASIINKKFKHKSIRKIEKLSDMTAQFLLHFPITVSQGGSMKRTEENYKIVFNWCFKFLKKKLNDLSIQQNRKVLSKKELEDHFYEFYFHGVAEEQDIDINKFFKPNFTNKLMNVEKTFNNQFITHIKLSRTFMTDFEEAMKIFIFSHMNLIDKKLKSLFVKWEEMITSEPNVDETLRKISNYIMKSSKCKLPWSKHEVMIAHRTVANLFK